MLILLASTFGCAQMRTGELDVDVALSKVAPPSTNGQTPPKAVANGPAKVDPIPSIVTSAKASDIQPAGAIAYPERPSTRRLAHRSVDGQIGSDGVFEIPVGLRVCTVPLIKPEVPPAQEIPPIEPILSEDNGLSKESAPENQTADEVPMPPADLLAEIPNVVESNSDIPIPRANAEPGDIAINVVPDSEATGETLVVANAIPRAANSPNPRTPGPTAEEGLALTGNSEVASDELLELLAAKDATEPSQSEDVAATSEEASQRTLSIAPVAAQSPETSLAVAKPNDESAPSALDFVPEPPALAEGKAFPAPPLLPVEARTPPTAKLALEHFHLCREILGFGNSVPMTTPPIPGQQLLAYVEVIDSECREVDGLFETKLSCRIAVEDSNGQTVAEQDFGQIVDRCTTRRKDFFCHFVFTLPPELKPGHYKLRLFALDAGDLARADGCVDLEIQTPLASKESGEP